MSRIVGVFSGKGGVGKTTCVLNIGLALHEMGEKVIVMDCNMRNSNLALHIGAYDLSTTLHDVLESDTSLLESIHIHSSGLRFVPSSIPIRYTDPAQALKLKDSLKDMNYTVIMDTPPGIGDDVLSLLRMADDVIVVTNPEIPSLTDTLKMIQLAIDMDKHVMGVIVNRVSKHHEVKAAHIAKVCRAPIIGIVPEDKNIKKSLHHRKPVLMFKPNSSSSIAFKSIGSKILGKEYKRPLSSKLRGAIRA